MTDGIAKTSIAVYETKDGWRYSVGKRDDGNYVNAADALWAAQEWLKTQRGDRT